MKTKLTFLLFCIVLLTGCKDEKAKTEAPAAGKISNGFKVTLKVLVKKDDTFSLFYTEDNGTDFSKIPPIWVDIKGSDIEQDVVFTLPEEVIPTQLRLDLGFHKDQLDMEIKKFKMEYADKSFEINGSQFYIYFAPDPTKTIFEKGSGIVKAVVKDGQRQNPSFYPNTTPLGEEISKLIK